MTEPSFGVRLQHLRTRRGLSREVFGGLLGRSGEWVKALERGRILMPRLPMLLRIAEVLHVNDLADLTGEQRVPVVSFSKGRHARTPVVADAMLASVPAADAEPDLRALRGRIDDAWRRWVTMPDQKSSVADVLPGLLAEARAAVWALDGTDRRRAQAELARVYSLAQCFFAYQPRGELVWVAADRAMVAAQDADDPLAMAAAAWYYGEAYRAYGHPEQARATALDCAALLDPAAGSEQRARWGHLQMSAALSDADSGNAGDAWRHWDRASSPIPSGDARPPTRSARTTTTRGCVSVARTWTASRCAWTSVWSDQLRRSAGRTRWICPRSRAPASGHGACSMSPKRTTSATNAPASST